MQTIADRIKSNLDEVARAAGLDPAEQAFDVEPVDEGFRVGFQPHPLDPRSWNGARISFIIEWKDLRRALSMRSYQPHRVGEPIGNVFEVVPDRSLPCEVAFEIDCLLRLRSVRRAPIEPRP